MITAEGADNPELACRVLVNAVVDQDRDLLEEEDMWLRLMHFVVLPAETLRDSDASPLFLPEQLQCAFRGIKVVAGNGLEHSLGQLDVAVLVFVVTVSWEASVQCHRQI